MGIILSIIVICFTFGLILLIIGIFWWDEAGFKAYSKGRAYYDEHGFHLNEEKEKKPGKRVIAWWPTKTKYGWIWLDYIWKDNA